VLRVAGLSVDLAARRVLDDVSFEVPPGVVVGLVGPNGAGKTTLLRAISGTRPAATGTIDAPRTIGYMPQLAPAVWEFPLSVLDVALQGSYRRTGWLKLPGRSERTRAREALDAVGMQGFARRQIGQLSGGQRQRVLLARTLVQDAPLVLLDEPMTGVDAATASLFLETLGDLREQGRSVMISTHDLGWAAQNCDLICLLSRTVHGFGTPDETLTAQSLSDVYGATTIDVGGVRILAPEGHHH
jgi:ABC-type Mn2+/Zn2+ transport system ATPase subunit